MQLFNAFSDVEWAACQNAHLMIRVLLSGQDFTVDTTGLNVVPIKPSQRKLKHYCVAVAYSQKRTAEARRFEEPGYEPSKYGANEPKADWGYIARHWSLPIDRFAAEVAAWRHLPDIRADLIRCIFGNPWCPVLLPEHIVSVEAGTPLTLRARPTYRMWVARTRDTINANTVSDSDSKGLVWVEPAHAPGQRACWEVWESPWVTDTVYNLAWNAVAHRAGKMVPKGPSTSSWVDSGLLDNQRLAVLADALQDNGCDHPQILAHLTKHKHHARGCWVLDLILGKE